MIPFNWPAEIVPSKTIVYAPQSVQAGSLSFAGYDNTAIVAGSRNTMSMEFAMFQGDTGRVVAWLLQNSQSVFQVPIWSTPQLVGYQALGLASEPGSQSLTFSNDQAFSNGVGFRFKPFLDIVAVSLEGEASITVETARYPNVLKPGHVFGIGYGVYHVRNIVYDGTVATIDISPPLRRDVTADDLVSLRPSLMCKPANMASFKSMFRPGNLISPGALEMNEWIDEQFL